MGDEDRRMGRMADVAVGDRVRIDIPDETDPDHNLHGTHGKVEEIIEDDAGQKTGDPRDSDLYRVALETGEEVDVRWQDIRPPFED
jgi:hypothetical protein